MDSQEIFDHYQDDDFQPQSIFSSPIQGIHLSDQRKNSHQSPSEVIIHFSHSFKKIVQKQNQDQQEPIENQLFDMLGNPICQFKTNQEMIEQFPPIIQDKQNQPLPLPKSTLQTPLKNKQLRSPLKDITPSMTKRKKKSSIKTISEKNTYLTPRTMAQSRFSCSSGMRRI